jgi:hypothetical protein
MPQPISRKPMMTTPTIPTTRASPGSTVTIDMLTMMVTKKTTKTMDRTKMVEDGVACLFYLCFLPATWVRTLNL